MCSESRSINSTEALMKLQTKFLLAIAVTSLSLCGALACSTRVDVATVPLDSKVQVTQQDGAVVEGTLTARDETTVTIKSARGTRRVARDEVADLQIVTPDNPAELPAIAKFREYVVPDGTKLQLSLVTPASSETSNVGDPVEATVEEPVKIDDVVVLPEGSVVHGKVTDATSAGKVKGRAGLALHFDTIVVGGERYPISLGIAVEAPSTKGKDAATIGISAGAGAIIGGILGGGKGAATGAAIGAGGGTGVVLLTEGKPVEFRRGLNMRLTLQKDVEVHVPVR
jgi:hypothetical protein